MKYLVDSNVLSEPTKPKPRLEVVFWLKERVVDLVVNPIVVGELEYGILILPKGKRRNRLLEWFAATVEGMNILDIDAETASHWARLYAELRSLGKSMPYRDSMISATARQYGLTVVTRNVADYRHAGVKLINPFSDD